MREIAFVAFLLGLVGTCLAAPSVELSTEVSMKSGSPTILFTLTNTSSESMQFARGLLPWSEGVFAIPMSVRPVAFPPNTELRQYYRLVNDVGYVSIEPGASASGEIMLRRRFPSLDAHLKKESLIVFWHWVPKPQGTGPLEPKAGWVILPSPAEAPNQSLQGTPAGKPAAAPELVR